MKEHGQIEMNAGGGELWKQGKRKEKMGSDALRFDAARPRCACLHFSLSEQSLSL
jgi:hypothetical protein